MKKILLVDAHVREKQIIKIVNLAELPTINDRGPIIERLNDYDLAVRIAELIQEHEIDRLLIDAMPMIEETLYLTVQGYLYEQGYMMNDRHEIVREKSYLG